MTTVLPPAPLTTSALDVVLEERLSDARTLPADAYLSPEILDWERKHLLEAAWVCVGRSSDVGAPGDQRAVRVGTQAILLTRDDAGVIHAFYNACRHRGHELLPADTCTNKKLIQCTYHSWVYGLDGGLRSATQFMDTENFSKEEWPLIGLRAAEWFGWIFVNASNDAPDFSEWVGNLTDVVAPWDPTDMVVAKSHTYTLQTNWKTVIENYLECYHCPSIHPELCRVSPPESAMSLHQTGMWLGGGLELRKDADTNSLDGRSGGERISGISDEQARWAYYFMLAPNLLLTLQPDYVMTHRLVPLAPGQTWVECSWLFPRDVAERPDFDPSFAASFWDVTNLQDFGACESVYQGMLTNGYRPGPFDEREDGVRAFQAQLATAYLTGRWEKPLAITLGARDAS
ncbi:aromatic ring-hydroxylating dioxygenase subunit alpha [Streptomyces sp. NPDC002088]|uniref:aromatic ring-hydroxylating oxygenase subunit alpha n=1 Tax=Streptomyces sp. NPDC002088 TaxID=3154665 RepID=UPI00331AB81B